VDVVGLKRNSWDRSFLQCFNTVGWVILLVKSRTWYVPIMCLVGR